MKILSCILLLSIAVACLGEPPAEDNKEKRELPSPLAHGGHSYGVSLGGGLGYATSTVNVFGPASKIGSRCITHGLPTGHNSGGYYSGLGSGNVLSGLNSHGALLGSSVPLQQHATQQLYGGGLSALSQGYGAVGSLSASIGASSALGLGYASGYGYGTPVLPSTSTTSHVTIEQPVPVPVSYPVAVQVTRPVPYHVAQPYAVHVPKPVPVEVPQAYPVNVPRPYAVTVNKPYPVGVPHIFQVPVPHPVHVEVPSPYLVPRPYPVPVKQPYPVHIPVATPVATVSEATLGTSSIGSSYSANLLGGGSGYSGLFTPSEIDVSLKSGAKYEGSTLAATDFGSNFGDAVKSIKYSENFQVAPLSLATGGRAGEKWTGLLTNNYGSHSLIHGSGDSLGAGLHKGSVSGSYRSGGDFFGKGGRLFGINSHKAKVEYDRDLYPYP